MNRPSRFFILMLVLTSFVLTERAAAQEENLTVVSDWLLHSDTQNALYRHLVGEAYQQLDRRDQRIARLQTKAEWKDHQTHVRRQLMKAVGPFPEKTPLNPRIIRTVEKDGFAVEHLIYHSRPDFPVTASLFVPDNLEGRAPAILFCTGHSQASYDRHTYQQVILNLVHKGFVVLAFDPVSQGERVQYLNPETGESLLESSTREHSYAGAQAFISDGSQARHAVWDGIRGIDYLLTREEVDPSRIGVHGLSGGGTQAAYIGAFDERVTAAAPSNYIVGFRRLLESIGPQDGEQNLYHQLALGLDHADFFVARAPKPSLIVATTRDAFSIQGARESYADAKRAYANLGHPGHMNMVEDDFEHAYTEKTREGIYAFFQQYLDQPGGSEDQDVSYLSPEEMRITATGQVQSSKFKGETLFTINRKEAEKKLEELTQSRENPSTHLPEVLDSAKRLSGYQAPEKLGEPVFRGRHQREGYVVEKYFLNGEGDYPIPYLLMIPDEGSNGKAVVYVHPEGKTAAAEPGAAMEQLVQQGYAVLAPDLLGVGEMGPVSTRWTVEGTPYSHWFLSVMTGRSIAGLHAGDIVRLVSVLEDHPRIRARDISAVAYDDLSAALLHAAAFEARISNVALVEPLISYRSLIATERYNPEYIMGAVAGALPSYDLPDLAASLAPDKLLIISPANGAGEHAGVELVNREYSIVRNVYEQADVPDKFTLRSSDRQNAADIIASWLD